MSRGAGSTEGAPAARRLAALAASCLALAAAPLAYPEAAEKPGASPALLREVQVGSGAGVEAVAFIVSGEVEASIRREENPPRIVLEFPGARSRAPRPALPEGLRLLSGLEVREQEGAGESGPLAVAVLELRQPAQIEVARSPGVISVILRPAAEPEASGSGSAAARAAREDEPGPDGEVIPLYLVGPAPAGDRAVGAPPPSAPGPGQRIHPEGPPLSLESPRTPSTSPDVPLGSLDLLHVQVLGVEALERRVRVAADGTITLPLVGSIRAAGLTVDGLEREIARHLVDGYVKDPQVSVFVEEFRSRRVSVSGAVRRPGSFEILRPATLLEALALAGGVLADEAAPRMQIVRPGAETPIEVDRLALQGGSLDQNLALQPGDLVHVPFDEMIEVRVEGRVARPDRYRVRRSEALTVLRAVMMAGGVLGHASGRRVEVVRREGEHRIRTLVVNLNRIREGREPDLPLQSDDVVVVR